MGRSSACVAQADKAVAQVQGWTRQYPIEYDVGGWYTFRIETRSGGLHYLLYHCDIPIL